VLPFSGLPHRHFNSTATQWEDRPLLRTILLVVLIVMLIGALPAWPYSAGWGYYPSGGLGLILLVVLVLALL